MAEIRTLELVHQGSIHIVKVDQNPVIIQPTVDPVLQDKTNIVPTEDEQTISYDAGYDGLNSVQINAIPSTYVGTDVAKRNVSSLTVDGATVTAPAGYYASNASKTVPSGAVGNITFTLDQANGMVEAHQTNEAGYISGNSSTTAYLLETQPATTIVPSDTQQTAVLAGKYTTGDVTVDAIPTDYVGPDVPRRDTSDISGIFFPGNSKINIPSGYYENNEEYSLPSGSVGNIDISISDRGVITASVDYQAGFVSGGGTSMVYPMPTVGPRTVSPTDQPQTVASKGSYVIGNIVVNPVSTTYVGSDVPRKTILDVVIQNGTVSVPSGYYEMASATFLPRGTVGDIGLAVDPATGVVSATQSNTSGWIQDSTKSGTLSLSVVEGSVITPTEAVQTAVSAGNYTLGDITVAAIPSDYVGSGIPRRTNTDITVRKSEVSFPAGYYANGWGQSVAMVPYEDPTYWFNKTTGVIDFWHTQHEGYVSADSSHITITLNTQEAATITPSEAEQTAVAQDRYTLGPVKVAAIPGTYVGSEVDRLPGATITPTDTAQTVVPADTYVTGDIIVEAGSHYDDGDNIDYGFLHNSSNIVGVGTAGAMSI